MIKKIIEKLDKKMKDSSKKGCCCGCGCDSKKDK